MLSNYVLITGGSDGIGLELAKLFAKDKHNLVLAARNIEKLNKAKEMLKGEGIDVRIISVDLSSMEECEKLYRLMCFNVYAHNRDDHSKNFTYLYNDEKDRWSLSPAYDLTYSNTYYGEHTTTVDGNGRNPGRKELLTVGIAAGMKKEVCIESMDMVEKCVKNMLGRYL